MKKESDQKCKGTTGANCDESFKAIEKKLNSKSVCKTTEVTVINLRKVKTKRQIFDSLQLENWLILQFIQLQHER